jgi:hypothetical protein
VVGFGEYRPTLVPDPVCRAADSVMAVCPDIEGAIIWERGIAMDVAKRLAAPAAFVLCAVLAWAGLAFFTPAAPWVPGDFYTLYSSVVAVSRGISPYDHPALALIQQSELGWDAVGLGVPSLPFFYPPWYVLLTLPLATLPFATATFAWLAVNFLLLMACCLLLVRTLGWNPGRWLILVLAGAMLFAPTLGDLVVGQYGMPVLFGACLVASMCATKFRAASSDDNGESGDGDTSDRWRPALAGLGLVLLTLKPQLGIGALLVACLWLARRRDFRPLVWGGGFLFVLAVLSFRVSPNWPAEVITAQSTYAAWAGIPFPIQGCDTCSTVAAIIEGAGVTGPVALALNVSVVLGLLVVVGAAWRRRGGEMVFLLSLACVATVLGTPYLRNYDLVILILPFFYLLRSTMGDDRRVSKPLATLTRLVLAVAYALPLIGTFAGDRLAVGRSGVVMAVALFGLLLAQARFGEASR